MLIVLQKEWLCLNCQTQRALSGQLGDLPPPPSPARMPAKTQATPPSSPARAVSTTPSPPAPTVNASPTKALIRTPSVTQAPADKSEHDSVTADAKCVVESAAKEQDEKFAVEESTQVLPEPNMEQTLDTAFENTTVNSTPPEQTIRAAVLPADIILRDIADAKETDAKLCEIVEQTEPKALSKMEGGRESEQHEPGEIDSPSNHVNITENHERTDKYPSKATELDNRAGVRLDRLQANKGKFKDEAHNKAQNGKSSTVHQENSENAYPACHNGPEVVSLSDDAAKDCSTELVSLVNVQTSADTIPDNNDDFNVELVANSKMVTEKEIIGIDDFSANTLEKKKIHPVQASSGKDEVKNMSNNHSDAKYPFAHTSKHPDDTKGKFTENEYEEEIKPGIMPSENPYVYSGKVKVQNDKIEGIYFDQAEGKQSEVEHESIVQGEAHMSTQISQAHFAEILECANPAFPTPKELIKFEPKTKHDILSTFSVLADTSKNAHKRTDGANVYATGKEAKGTNTLPQTQVVESLVSKAVELTAGKENKETLENKLECETREKTKHRDQPSPTGEKELKKFSAGENIVVTDIAKKEKVLQNEEIENTTEPESSNKDHDHSPKFTISQVVEACPVSQMSVPKTEYMLLDNTQPMVKLLEQADPSVDDKEHSEKVEKTNKIEHNDIKSKMSSSSLTEAEKVLNISKEKTVKSNSDSVKTENVSVVKKNNSLPTVEDQEFPVPEDKKIKQPLDTASGHAPEQSAIPLFQVVDIKDDIQLKRQIELNWQQSVPLAQMFGFPSISDKENEVVIGERTVKSDSQPTKEVPQVNTQPDTNSVFCSLDPVVESTPPCHVASKQDKDKSFEEIQSPGTQKKDQDQPRDFEKLGQVTLCGAWTSREKC